ncbi:reprolysin-like metallopeptidase [Pseudomonas sp. Irchel s3b5]|jgi:hypothetical protein|uniref:reprolysin-like metallopeptidase n=1 Tax=Pseudomonas sp. Irchel s3b5 TaxID=2009077 RepID=UPI000BA43FEA|nr:hypothetical protein [Pseudomonas sp. Irchel s3b5]
MPLLPITLTVFLHEDLKDQNLNLLCSHYFDWLEDHITVISGRDMNTEFIKPSDAPGISSIDYKTEDLQHLLKKFNAEVVLYVKNTNGSFENAIHKYMLLTRDIINETTLGVAASPGAFAVASITDYFTAAHELGHMLGASHEDSGDVTTYHGPVKSLMHATAGDVGARFSQINEDNIRRYLGQYD